MSLFSRKTRPMAAQCVEIPPGQVLTQKFPAMSVGPTPRVPTYEWRLRVWGLVARPIELTWEAFVSLPQVTITADFHCVTQWSRLGNVWQGVRVQDVLEQVEPLPPAKYVMAHCYDGYTTNLDLDVLMQEESLFVHSRDGQPLDPSHGAPVRLLVPRRYGWKSAKWVHSLELMEKDSPGFWEARGYHMRGDFWKEERFRNA